MKPLSFMGMLLGSLVFPPALLVTVPLMVGMVRAEQNRGNHALEQRRMQYAAQQRQQAVRYFR